MRRVTRGRTLLVRGLSPSALVFLALACGVPGKGNSSATASHSAALCMDSPAPDLFEPFGVCVCSDMVDTGNLDLLSAIDGTPTTLGVNGTLEFVGNSSLGSLDVLGTTSVVGNVHIPGDARLRDVVDVHANLTVDGNLNVGGDLTGAGNIEVGGTLGVAGDESFVGNMSVGVRDAYSLAGTEAPCPCGEIDVAAQVELARSAHDNEEIGLSSTIAGTGNETLILPSGRYFLESLEHTGNLKIQVVGEVSLYVADSLDLAGNIKIELGPESVLDLYVAGDVEAVGNVKQVGESTLPSPFRLFVGGDATVRYVGNEQLRGAIFAPDADFEITGNAGIVGSVLVRGLVGVGNLQLRQATPLNVPVGCEPESPLEPEPDA